MQVSVTATGGLERRLEVAVPAEAVSSAVDQRLKSLSRTARLKGFRAGKVPYTVIRQQFGSQVHAEVVNELLRSSFSEAVSQENLKPATGPRIEPLAMEPGTELRYVATFEVLPDLHVADVAALEIERPVADVTDADIEAMIETMRRQRPVFTPVERAAGEGDRVTIDYDGNIDDAPFKGGEGRDAKVIIGRGEVMPEFETALRGAKAGETRTAQLVFPTDQANSQLAGRTAAFTLAVRQVEEQSLPEVDAAFAAQFGVAEGGVEALRTEVRGSMERELDEAVRNQVRAAVMDALVRENPVEVPRALVEETVQQMQLDMGRRMGAKDTSQLPPREPFQDPARRRVALGLIVGELLKQSELKVDRARVQMKLADVAATYPNPDEVRRSYLQNADAMRQLESSVLEEQLIDWILGKAKVVPKASSFKELTRFSQEGAA